MSRKVIVAGGSGFVGTALVSELQSTGYEVVILARKARTGGPVRVVEWDGRTLGSWAEEFRDALGVVNLAGETISQKWTYQAQQSIVGSRVNSARAISEAIRQCGGQGVRWVNASAIGFYGHREEPVDERSEPGTGFLAETTLKWEQAVTESTPPNAATTRVRIGVVLGREGGALPTLAQLSRIGLGGKVGNGRQGMSWITVNDLARLIRWVLEHPNPPAVVNGTAPNPATNAEFMRALQTATGAPIALPAPAFGVMLYGVFGGPDPSLVLEGALVAPKVAIEQGFQFENPELVATLRGLVGKAR